MRRRENKSQNGSRRATDRSGVDTVKKWLESCDNADARTVSKHRYFRSNVSIPRGKAVPDIDTERNGTTTSRCFGFGPRLRVHAPSENKPVTSSPPLSLPRTRCRDALRRPGSVANLLDNPLNLVDFIDSRWEKNALSG